MIQQNRHEQAATDADSHLQSGSPTNPQKETLQLRMSHAACSVVDWPPRLFLPKYAGDNDALCYNAAEFMEE
jgi:hypothetical protein